MKKRRHLPSLAGIVVVPMLMAFLACADSTGGPGDPIATDPGDAGDTTASTSDVLINQTYLFEVYYINFAWGYQHRGIVIDRDGNVFRYFYDKDDEPWHARDYIEIKEDDLTRKYDHNKELIATVERPDLMENYRLISAAATGELSERKHAACDMGSFVYNAFSYNAATKRYTPILLKLLGDYEQKNLSDEAAQLCDWLKTVRPVDW